MPDCPDCKGTRKYVGMNEVKPCPTCCGGETYGKSPVQGCMEWALKHGLVTFYKVDEIISEVKTPSNPDFITGNGPGKEPNGMILTDDPNSGESVSKEELDKAKDYFARLRDQRKDNEDAELDLGSEYAKYNPDVIEKSKGNDYEFTNLKIAASEIQVKDKSLGQISNESIRNRLLAGEVFYSGGYRYRRVGSLQSYKTFQSEVTTDRQDRDDSILSKRPEVTKFDPEQIKLDHGEGAQWSADNKDLVSGETHESVGYYAKPCIEVSADISEEQRERLRQFFREEYKGTDKSPVFMSKDTFKRIKFKAFGILNDEAYRKLFGPDVDVPQILDHPVVFEDGTKNTLGNSQEGETD